MKTRKETLNFTTILYPNVNGGWLVAHNPETRAATRGKTFEPAPANGEEAAKGRRILTTFEVSSVAHGLT
jgi:hypothetical protein